MEQVVREKFNRFPCSKDLIIVLHWTRSLGLAAESKQSMDVFVQERVHSESVICNAESGMNHNHGSDLFACVPVEKIQRIIFRKQLQE